MNNTSQRQSVLRYLFDHQSITSATAMNVLGIERLASRIHELKKMGYHIDRQMISVTKRDGSTVKVASYSLIDEEEK